MLKNCDLLQTDDASVWAKGFVEHKKVNNWSIDDIDEGLMLCWFANAIETAKDRLVISLKEKHNIIAP